MKKEYIIGGLAIVGAIALIAWYKKPKKNSEGFFSASGKSGKATQKWCAHRNADGSVQYATSTRRGCPKGWASVRGFGDREGV
jgi:L-amino acid N-acyltransferase YncA